MRADQLAEIRRTGRSSFVLFGDNVRLTTLYTHGRDGACDLALRLADRKGYWQHYARLLVMPREGWDDAGQLRSGLVILERPK